MELMTLTRAIIMKMLIKICSDRDQVVDESLSLHAALSNLFLMMTVN